MVDACAKKKQTRRGADSEQMPYCRLYINDHGVPRGSRSLD